MSYGPNIGPTSSEPGTITMRAGGLVAKRREYFEVGDVCDSHFKKNPSSTSSRDNGRTTQEAV